LNYGVAEILKPSGSCFN